MLSRLEKKQLKIFIIVAYGITFLMGGLMAYGNGRKLDVSAFPNAQMMYPAAGVMLAYLLTKRKEQKTPTRFFLAFLVLTVFLMGISILSVIAPGNYLHIAGMNISIWALAVQYAMIVGSIVCWIFYLTSGKEKRKEYGLCWRNSKASVACIVLFIALYMLRTVISYGISGDMESFFEIVKNPTTWISMAALAINFFLVFVAFFGEEYGWRYYLQPLLQKRFGLRGGVIVLGIVWGLWHLPVDFFYYTRPEMGFAAAASQQITCITLGIFFAYAYMKTQNIWVPVILHFLNNNLIPIIVGNYSVDVLQNQEIHWGQLPMTLVINGLIFGSFLLAKPFRKKEIS